MHKIESAMTPGRRRCRRQTLANPTPLGIVNDTKFKWLRFIAALRALGACRCWQVHETAVPPLETHLSTFCGIAASDPVRILAHSLQ